MVAEVEQTSGVSSFVESTNKNNSTFERAKGTGYEYE